LITIKSEAAAREKMISAQSRAFIPMELHP